MSHMKTQGDILGRVTFAIQWSAAAAEHEAAARRAGGSRDLRFCFSCSTEHQGAFTPLPQLQQQRNTRNRPLGSKLTGGRGAEKWTQLNRNSSTRPHVSLFTGITARQEKWKKKYLQVSGVIYSQSRDVFSMRLSSSSFFFRDPAELVNHNAKKINSSKYYTDKALRPIQVCSYENKDADLNKNDKKHLALRWSEKWNGNVDITTTSLQSLSPPQLWFSEAPPLLF